jgi:hypothetical protein
MYQKNFGECSMSALLSALLLTIVGGAHRPAVMRRLARFQR